MKHWTDTRCENGNSVSTKCEHKHITYCCNVVLSIDTDLTGCVYENEYNLTQSFGRAWSGRAGPSMHKYFTTNAFFALNKTKSSNIKFAMRKEMARRRKWCVVNEPIKKGLHPSIMSFDSNRKVSTSLIFTKFVNVSLQWETFKNHKQIESNYNYKMSIETVICVSFVEKWPPSQCVNVSFLTASFVKRKISFIIIILDLESIFFLAHRMTSVPTDSIRLRHRCCCKSHSSFASSHIVLETLSAANVSGT